MKGTTITVWCLAALMSVPIQAQTDSFEELFGQAKDFEQLYLPGYTHDLGGEYINKRVFRFFYRNCMNQ